MNRFQTTPLRTIHLIFRQALLISISVLFFQELIAQVSADLSPGELKKLSMEELMNIEVTSVSRRSEKLTEAASAIQVITRDDIRRSGATSIPEALRLASNLHVAQKNSHDWAISARGFNTDLANKLLVLIDGRTVYTPLFSGVFWDRQDYLLEDVERIEVISGPGSTLWGSNAVNGVINIITRSASETRGVYAEGGGGTQLQGFGGLRYGGRINEDVSFRVYGKYFDRDDTVFPSGEDASDSWQMGQGGFRMEAARTQKNTFILQGDYYKSDINLSNGGKSNVKGSNILGRWTRTFSENSDMKLQLYYDRTYLDQPVPESRTEDGAIVIAPAGTLSDDLDTYDLDFQHGFNLGGRNHVVWGLGYRYTHDVVGNAPGLAFSPPNLERNLFSGFLQDEITLAEKFFITLGTKIEHNDYTGFEYSPSLRLQSNIATNQTIWAAASRAVRIPSRVDRHLRFPTPALAPLGIENLLVGGEGFEAETVVAFELGYRGQFSSKISSSIATFYNIYDDVRSTSLSPPHPILGTPFPLYYENNLEGETYGVELNITCQMFDWWQLRSGYSLFHEDIRVKPGKFDFNNAINETADPKHRFTLMSSMNLSSKLQLYLGLRSVDSFRYNNNVQADTVSSYTELEARLAWLPVKNLEFSITGQNLLHDQHAEFVISNPNPRAEIQRNIYIKVTCRF